MSTATLPYLIGNNSQQNFQFRYYLKAITDTALKKNAVLLTEYAKFSDQWGDTDQAEDYFLRALEIDPNYTDALTRYADLLIYRRNLNSIGNAFHERAQKIEKIKGIIKDWKNTSLGLEDAQNKIEAIRATVKAKKHASTRKTLSKGMGGGSAVKMSVDKN